MKKTKGITLIALVITIIVLLILVGVSISAVIGENGIVSKSKVSSENTRGSKLEEQVMLAENENSMLKYTSGTWITKENLVIKLENDGTLTAKEADALLGRNGETEVSVIKVGEIEIDFSVLEKRIIVSEPIWENGLATVNLVSAGATYEIEWKLEGSEEWAIGTTITELHHGDVIYVRFVGDSDENAQQVVIEDTNPPIVTLNVTQNNNMSISIEVTIDDEESGVPETPTYTYYLKVSSATEYSAPITTGNFEKIVAALEDSEDLLYDIKVTVLDNAGNVGVGEVLEFQAQLRTGCFVAGTKISTAEGLKNIEDINVGDKVYSYNEELEQIEEQEVSSAFVFKRSEIYTLTLENGEKIQNTNDHPYCVVNKGWMLTEDLGIGDEVITQENEKIKIVNIEVNTDKIVNVYNIEVANNHNYYVGTTKILVHNKMVCFVAGTKVSTINGLKNIEEIEVGDIVYTYNEDTNQVEEQEVLTVWENKANEILKLTFDDGNVVQNTPRHAYYVIGKGWTLAKDLSIGDEILTENGTTVKLENVDMNNEEIVPVYNLTIANNHNYFVGESKLLVHNVVK